jgi:predicted phage terminase large subunit-like protein
MALKTKAPLSSGPITAPADQVPSVLEKLTAKAIALRDERAAPPKLSAELGDDPAEKQRRCKADIGEYGEFMFGLAPEPHHRIWIDLIQKLLRDELIDEETGRVYKNLLIVAPPGTAKSHWVSTVLPSWYLGNHPDQQILFLTSSDKNAKDFGGTVRAALEDSDRYRAVFPESACRPAKKRGWSSDGYFLQGLPLGAPFSSYYASGFDTRIIGRRCDLFILDDPLDEKSSRSALEQAAAKDYFENTLKTRSRPTTGHTVAIMTRWHESDFADHLLDKQDWYAVRCPMVAEEPTAEPEELEQYSKRLLPDPTLKVNGGYREPGDYLWPNYFTPEQVEEERNNGTARFSLVFQCSVTGQGGDIFGGSEWLKPLPVDFFDLREDGKTLKESLTIYLGWDTAFSMRDKACESVGLVVGFDKSLRGYVLDMWHDRVGQAGLEDAMIEMIQKWKPHIMLVEEVAFKAGVVKEIIRRVQTRVACRIVMVRPEGDKVERAHLPAGRAEAGFLYGDHRAKWWPTFRDQCLTFPNSRFKDIVDALSLIFQFRFAPAQMKDRTKKRQAVVNPNVRRGRGRRGRPKYIISGR